MTPEWMTDVRSPDGPEPVAAPRASGGDAVAVPQATGGDAGVEHFGWLFPGLPPLDSDDDDLERLAATMIERRGSGPWNPAGAVIDPGVPSNSEIPAGFTYLGQFIDHDLTWDDASRLFRREDVTSLPNKRTPRFDLDSVYNGGPARSPRLYREDGVRFRIDRNADGEHDLPRDENGRAVIGDPRNDENLIVSQLHLALLKFHNKVVTRLDRAATFEEARTIVRWHYQWIVLHDFLPRIVGADVLRDILRQEPFVVSTASGARHAMAATPHLRFFRWQATPVRLPAEFAVAVYRFGHTMIRAAYALNTRTALAGIPIFDPTDHSANPRDLRGGRARPPGRRIEWSRFFPFPHAAARLQFARALDTQLAAPLGHLPPEVLARVEAWPRRDRPITSLALLDLLRGEAFGLPSGQSIARAMAIPEDLILTLDNRKLPFTAGTSYAFGGRRDPSSPAIPRAQKEYLQQRFGDATPLWYYVLKEAELLGAGRQLGPVGGRIVAEVCIGLLLADPESFLTAAPGWQPRRGQFGCARDGAFSMSDLLEYLEYPPEGGPPGPGGAVAWLEDGSSGKGGPQWDPNPATS